MKKQVSATVWLNPVFLIVLEVLQEDYQGFNVAALSFFFFKKNWILQLFCAGFVTHTSTVFKNDQ